MRFITALMGTALVLWACPGGPAGRAGEPEKNAGPPDVVVVRVTAAKDGTVLDVEFETVAGDTVVRTPTGLARHYRERLPGQPAVVVDWKKVVTEGLVRFRKEQGLKEQCIIQVAPDDNLNFGPAADVLQCCRKAGFKQVEFTTGEPGRIVLVVGADGQATAEGKLLASEEIGPYLLGKAKALGGADKVEVAIHAHPQAKYAAVARLVREVKAGGYRGVRVEAQRTEGPK